MLIPALGNSVVQALPTAPQLRKSVLVAGGCEASSGSEIHTVGATPSTVIIQNSPRTVSPPSGSPESLRNVWYASDGLRFAVPVVRSAFTRVNRWLGLS